MIVSSPNELIRGGDKASSMYHRILDPQTTQLHNLNLILKQIKSKGPLSRADIARNLSCSKSMVTSNIAELIQYGLVREMGKGNPSKGRKSTLLEFNPRSHFVVGVDTRPEHLNVVLSDLEGTILTDLSFKPKKFDPSTFIPTLCRGIARVIERSGVEKSTILAIGLMVSGVVNPLSGTVQYSALLGWDKPVELAQEVQSSVGLPVYLENDVNALALAEYWLTHGQAVPSLAYLYVNKGVGGAYIDHGVISQGADFAFAEFGKLIISGDSAPARLEAYISLDALIRRFKPPLSQVGMKEFNRYLATHREEAERIYSFLISSLSQSLTTFVAILNPHLCILGGGIDFKDDFISKLTEHTRRLLPPLPLRTLRIESAKLKGKSEVLGAVAVALSNTRFKFIVQG